MKDLHHVLAETGHPLSENRIRRIIKAGGFRWRKARTVLTSNYHQYQSKLDVIKGILSALMPNEAFLSIDEYGPFALKRKGGRKRVGPGEKSSFRSGKVKRVDDRHSGSRAFSEPGDPFLFP